MRPKQAEPIVEKATQSAVPTPDYSKWCDTQFKVQIAHIEFLGKFHPDLVTLELIDKKQQLQDVLDSRATSPEDCSEIYKIAHNNEKLWGFPPAIDSRGKAKS